MDSDTSTLIRKLKIAIGLLILTILALTWRYETDLQKIRETTYVLAQATQENSTVEFFSRFDSDLRVLEWVREKARPKYI